LSAPHICGHDVDDTRSAAACLDPEPALWREQGT
jgi:hypothetical protein